MAVSRGVVEDGVMAAVMLFEDPYGRSALGRNYDVASDGRFLIITGAGQKMGDARPLEIHVALTWFQELTERALVP